MNAIGNILYKVSSLEGAVLTEVHPSIPPTALVNEINVLNSLPSSQYAFSKSRRKNREVVLFLQIIL